MSMKKANTIVTFAVLAVKGRNVPWNSNLIERLMGEFINSEGKIISPGGVHR